MGSQNKIISVGFSKNSERQFSVWDARNLVDPLGTVLIDSSSGVITPYYDEGTGILFTLGKGDATIPYYEIVDEAPYGHFLSKFQAPDPAVGVAVLPTRLNNVAEVEFVSMLKLTTQRIQPLTFTVPRTRVCFQFLLPPLFLYFVSTFHFSFENNRKNSSKTIFSHQPAVVNLHYLQMTGLLVEMQTHH